MKRKKGGKGGKGKGGKLHFKRKKGGNFKKKKHLFVEEKRGETSKRERETPVPLLTYSSSSFSSPSFLLRRQLENYAFSKAGK